MSRPGWMTQRLRAGVIHPIQTCMACCRLQSHERRQSGFHSSICKQAAMPGVCQGEALVFHRTTEIGANTVFFLFISVLTTEERLTHDLIYAFPNLVWKILYWSCYSTCIRRAKASWLTFFRLSNRSYTLTLRDHKRSCPIWIYFSNTCESTSLQYSQRLVYLYISEFRTSHILNWICQSQPCNTHFAGDEVPMAKFTFLLGVGAWKSVFIFILPIIWWL